MQSWVDAIRAPGASSVVMTLSISAWLTLSMGCTTVSRPPSVAPPPPMLTAQELVARLQEKGAAIQTMKAQFSIEATGKEIKGTQRMEAAMTYQRPNQIRLRAFARIGFPIFDLTLIDDRYQMKIPMQGKLLTGRVTDLDQHHGLGPSILLGVQATLGNLNGTTVSATDRLTLHEEAGLYVLEVTPSEHGAAGRRLWFDQRTLELMREEFLGSAGQTQATIIFHDYRPVGSVAGDSKGQVVEIVRPYLVRAEDAGGRAKLVLTFREIVPNPELSPDDWGTTGVVPLAASPGRAFYARGSALETN
jgi:outer membrane lipoprotein-sorting protein